MTNRWIGRVLVALWVLALGVPAEVIDKIVAVVGKQAITASEVEQRVRLEALLNRQPLDLSVERRREALDRLTEWRLLEQEMTVGNLLDTGEQKEVAKGMKELERGKFIEDRSLQSALELYGLRQEDLSEFLREQVLFRRYWEFRFKTGLEALPEEVKRYYEREFVPEFRKTHQSDPPPLEEVSSQIAEILVERRAMELLDDWLKEMRAVTRVEILDPELRRVR